MQALMMHDAGTPGEHNLFMLGCVLMQRAVALARTDRDAASAVVFQLLPPLAW